MTWSCDGSERRTVLVPTRVIPKENLSGAGLDAEQRADLLAWCLGIGAGAAGATITIGDVMFFPADGTAFLRFVVLGPVGWGHVDVLLRVEEKLPMGTRRPRDWHAIKPGNFEDFGSLADEYIDTIAGGRTGYQQLCLLDIDAQPFW